MNGLNLINVAKRNPACYSVEQSIGKNLSIIRKTKTSTRITTINPQGQIINNTRQEINNMRTYIYNNENKGLFVESFDGFVACISNYVSGKCKNFSELKQFIIENCKGKS